MCQSLPPGTSVRAEDVSGGAALVFTTTGDVDALRARLQQMADHHNAMAGSTPSGGGMGPGGGGMGPGSGMVPGGSGMGHSGGGMGSMMGMPASTARVENVDRGARLVFVPKDPKSLGALQEIVRGRATRMAAGGCPQTSGHGDGCC
jgi:hypothetical protein